MGNGSCAITDDKNRKYNFLNWEGRRENVEEFEKKQTKTKQEKKYWTLKWRTFQDQETRLKDVRIADTGKNNF
jgi:hypothetical protein